MEWYILSNGNLLGILKSTKKYDVKNDRQLSERTYLKYVCLKGKLKKTSKNYIDLMKWRDR
jgi:hypothetical protein